MTVERDTLNVWALCACGHMWLQHDVYGYRGDDTETCCVWGCDQNGCPGAPTPERNPDARQPA